MASTTAGPRGRLFGAPNMSSTAEPLTTPQPRARTRSVGTSPPATARKIRPKTTVIQPARRHARLTQGEPRMTTATLLATQFESISGWALTQSGRITARSSPGWPSCCTMPWSKAARRSCANRGRRDEHHEQPEPAVPQCDDKDRGEDERREALEDQVDDVCDRLGQRVEGVYQVALEADERVGRACGEQESDQDEQHTDDQAEHDPKASARADRPAVRRSRVASPAVRARGATASSGARDRSPRLSAGRSLSRRCNPAPSPRR